MKESHEDIFQKQNKALVYTTFLQREEGRYHHSYDEELIIYDYVRNGDLRSIDEGKKLFQSDHIGVLSADELRNKKYLFVASTTLTTRFCIEGGMDSQTAYNLSDLYIQQADLCQTVKQVNDLQITMITDFTHKMIDIHAQARIADLCHASATSSSNPTLSKPIAECIDYIYYHLHLRITLKDLAEAVSLTPNYLASLFKKEKGISIQQYIHITKIETAKNMLLYSDYSLTEIGEFLAFSSSSHFIKIFREVTGMTPKQFQKTQFRTHNKWAKK